MCIAPKRSMHGFWLYILKMLAPEIEYNNVKT